MKMKLPFLQLEKEFVQIISPEDLKQIVGGTYGGPTASWDTMNGFLENVTGFLSSGVADYTGSSNYQGTFSESSLSGSGSTPFNIFNVPSGSLSPTYTFQFASNNFNTFQWGSPTNSGSNPVPLLGTWGSYQVSFTNAGGTKPSITYTGPDGKKVSVSFNTATKQLSLGINIF